MSKLRLVQEFLSEVEEYLRGSLENEKLSACAQIKRRHLLDRFYALDLHANDQRNPLGSTVNSTTTAKSSIPPNITAVKSSTSLNSTTAKSSTSPNITTAKISTSPIITTAKISTSPNITTAKSSTFSSVSQAIAKKNCEKVETNLGEDQNLYEEPVIYNTNPTENSNSTLSDDGSDTEYESYDEDDEGHVVYVDHANKRTQNRNDILLPL